MVIYMGKNAISGKNKNGQEVFLENGQKGQIMNLGERTLYVRLDYKTGDTTTFATKFETDDGVFDMVPLLDLK